MPKRIDNLKEIILEEAKRQVMENGYSKTTIRSVAQGCNIGIGTMYNYFKSKDDLISSFMLDDWKNCVQEMTSLDTADAKQFLGRIQEILSGFATRYRKIFNDPEAIKSYASVFAERHVQLRAKIGSIIQPVCPRGKVSDDSFLAEHVAESILRWTMAGEPFDKQYEIIKLLIC